jgi:hypothetical protein
LVLDTIVHNKTVNLTLVSWSQIIDVEPNRPPWGSFPLSDEIISSICSKKSWKSWKFYSFDEKGKTNTSSLKSWARGKLLSFVLKPNYFKYLCRTVTVEAGRWLRMRPAFKQEIIQRVWFTARVKIMPCLFCKGLSG